MWRAAKEKLDEWRSTRRPQTRSFQWAETPEEPRFEEYGNSWHAPLPYDADFLGAKTGLFYNGKEVRNPENLPPKAHLERISFALYSKGKTLYLALKKPHSTQVIDATIQECLHCFSVPQKQKQGLVQPRAGIAYFSYFRSEIIKYAKEKGILNESE